MALGRFLSKAILEPRKTPRIKRAFQVNCSSDGGRTYNRALPVDISLGGIGLLASRELPEDEFIISLRLERKNVRARVRKVSSEKGLLRGKLAWRIGTRFLNLAIDDLELVDKFVQRVPLDPADKLRGDLQLLSLWPDAADRILPKTILDRLLVELVSLDRLAPLEPDTTPLVKFHYTGQMVREGERIHGVKILSRVFRDHVAMNYQTQVYFNETMTNIEAIPLDNGKRAGTAEPVLPTVKKRSDRLRRLSAAFRRKISPDWAAAV